MHACMHAAMNYLCIKHFNSEPEFVSTSIALAVSTIMDLVSAHLSLVSGSQIRKTDSALKINLLQL